VLADPHVEHMGLVQPLRLPNGVETKTVGFPVKIGGCETGAVRSPPALGADSEAVFAEWLA
jgi:crotonobetainyl-CoA:carnitine CoA-transferase CaiB-like acyl-CoA transferase